MLYKNDVFELDGVRMRLVYSDVSANTAYCICLEDDAGWPISVPHAEIADLRPLPVAEANQRVPSDASIRKCKEAWSRLAPLLERSGLKLLDPQQRNRAVLDYAAEYQCSPATLRKDLRRYWLRGQTMYALLPDYEKSGRPKVSEGDGCFAFTSGRGRKPKAEYDVYQLTATDLGYMKRIIESGYLTDARISTVDAYKELVRQHYRYEDGNLQPFVNHPGALPTLRQFRYYLLTHYDIEVRLRGREGDSDYEREHRKVLGTTLDYCHGVGHYYEIDSTISDIFLVSREDVNDIIGKATVYLIVDRKSRLIVGFYFGVENASWNAALQAILSISQDKRVLCERYGVEYNPSDWPAHQVFPQQFLADRGDMISGPSNSIVEELHVTVTNLPSKRPDWKPLVESMFRRMHNELRSKAPAYDPPSNATRRRGKHYEAEACLTVRDFGNLLLNTIIHINRQALRSYDLSPAELAAGILPSPLALWNHGITSRAGLLTRFPEEHVRLALLRKESAVVTEHGVEFKGLFYTFDFAISRKWFEHARKKRFEVVVSYDPRLVDQIYVHIPGGKTPPCIATPTQRSQKYLGYSFDEIKHLENLREQVEFESVQQRLQEDMTYHDRIAPVVANAEQRLKAAGPKVSRSGRRADTKTARGKERSHERKELARLQEMPGPANAVPESVAQPGTTTTNRNQQDRFGAIRARMLP
jgi:hypothetical protein